MTDWVLLCWNSRGSPTIHLQVQRILGAAILEVLVSLVGEGSPCAW